MSSPMNQTPYFSLPEQPPESPQDPTWQQAGVYQVPEYKDLTRGSISDAPAAPYGWTRDNLGENDYRAGAYASGSDVDLHRNTDKVHGPSYEEVGPRPYPN